MAKLFSTKTSGLPSRGNPGDVYFAVDTGTVYLALGDGTLFNVNDLMAGGGVARVVGPRGEKGDPGPAGNDSIVPGPQGTAGRDGRDGAQGPPGVGKQGDPGPQGKRGDDGKPGRDGKDGDAGKAVAELKNEIQSLKATVNALLDMNKRAGEYIEWLRARAAARRG